MSKGMKRIECYWGESGAGKSTAALEIARRVYQETGKKTAVAIGDGSAATYADSGLVDAGVIEIADYAGRPHPFTVMDQLARGFKESDSGQLVPRTAAEMAEIGCWIFEGLSVGAAYMMGDVEGGLAYRSGKGEKIGQDSPIQIKDNISGGITIGGNPIAHFPIAQRRIVSAVETSKNLPGWVIWTAHEKSAEDKNTGEKVIGPEVAGKALTANISRIFNNTLHFTTAVAKKKEDDKHTGKKVDIVDTEYRIYTRDHFDPDGISFVKYKAVSRCADPSKMPLYLVGKTPGENIMQFYQIIAETKAASLAALQPVQQIAS